MASIEIKTLTLNIWGLPKLICPSPETRAEKILSYINDFDICFIQEAFSLPVIEIIKKSDHPCKAFGIYKRLFPFARRLGDGLAILSRFPLKNTKHHTFNKLLSAHMDIFADKGVLYTQAEVAKDLTLDLATTHVQAFDVVGNYSRFIRKRQVREFVSFLRRQNTDHPLLIGGDFNSPVTQDDYPYILKKLNVQDAWMKYVFNHPEIEETYGFTHSNENTWNNNKSDQFNYRLDLNLYRHGAKHRVDVIESKVTMRDAYFENKHLSDHFGVATTYRVKPK
jgi:endonuclease/exonuclease/phosphatase family metal-dependent hydrolase